jgi:hypothetical protein
LGVRDAARKVGVSIVSAVAENPEEITTAFATFSDQRVQAVLVAVDAVFFCSGVELLNWR